MKDISFSAEDSLLICCNSVITGSLGKICLMLLKMETIFSDAWKDKRGLGEEEARHKAGLPIDSYVDDEQGLQRRHAVDTTLIVHFFGKKGNNELRYEGFRK